MSAIEVERLDARHGLLVAVREVSLAVPKGSILALVGANGAGKTTLLRTIAGAHRATSGRVLLDGADVTAVPAHRRTRMGIALVPEGRRLFGNMTVSENLRVAGRTGRPGRWTYETVIEAFPMLKPLLAQRAGTLSGGQQQATAIARGLMTNPSVLLIDELSLGLSPIAVDAVYQSLQSAMEGDTTIVLVEQDLARVLRVASHVACMLEGRIVLDGSAASLTREQIVEAYFGLRQAAPNAVSA